MACNVAIKSAEIGIENSSVRNIHAINASVRSPLKTMNICNAGTAQSNALLVMAWQASGRARLTGTMGAHDIPCLEWDMDC